MQHSQLVRFNFKFQKFQKLLILFIKFIFLDCPTLKPGEGALESNRDTAFGTTVTFSCPVGQEFATGKSKITTECLIGGNWSVSYIPKCQGKSNIIK